MAEVLLSCEMLEDEMQLALQRTGVQMPIVWLDAGLHEYPAKLRASLREKIAELEQSYDTILLGFCLCGNAMDGVGASRARLVVPRFDDCIRMLMSRAQGYAVESGELQIGLKSVAAPVFDPDGQCEYAISAVTIARSGMAGDNFQKLQEVVIRTAEEITCELRHPSAHGR